VSGRRTEREVLETKAQWRGQVRTQERFDQVKALQGLKKEGKEKIQQKAGLWTIECYKQK